MLSTAHISEKYVGGTGSPLIILRPIPISGAIALSTKLLSQSMPPKRLPVTDRTSSLRSSWLERSGESLIQQISVVPPPISTISVVVSLGRVCSILYAAAMGSSRKLTPENPAFVAASVIIWMACAFPSSPRVPWNLTGRPITALLTALPSCCSAHCLKYANCLAIIPMNACFWSPSSEAPRKFLGE